MQSSEAKISRPVSNGEKNFIAGMFPVIGEIIFLAFLILMFRWLAPTAYVPFFMYGEYFSVVLGSVVLVLLITGLLPSFLKSFPYGFCRVDVADEKKLKKSRLSVMTAIITALLAGLVSTFITVIDVLSRTVTDGSIYNENIGLFLSIACTGVLYGFIIAILLVPLYIRLKLKTL